MVTARPNGATLPDVKEQIKQCKSLLEYSKPKVGDTWYLLSYAWFEKWQAYTGFNVTLASESSYPGPVDNSRLIDPTTRLVRRDLVQERDFTVVPEDIWVRFVNWFGGEDSAIKRGCVEEGKFVRHTQVEIYPIALKVHLHTSLAEHVWLEVGKRDSIKLVIAAVKECFALPTGVLTQLWYKQKGLNEIELLSGTSEARLAGEWPLVEGSTLVLEYRQHESEQWPSATEKFQEEAKAQFGAISTVVGRSRFGVLPASDGLPSYESATASAFKTTERGRCGLNNLGNTCFMNSALQCLSNCPRLTHYFINDEYHEEINKSNVLGTGGRLVEAYATLVKKLWSGTASSLSPSAFKQTVGDFAPRFSGYAQQDSQELLAFLLDGLHEDLNRVIKKPYRELKTPSEDTSDSVLAEDAWDYYVSRNNSLIVDLFHGQLKSQITCDKCHLISNCFDPFLFLSLPLPKSQKQVEVRFIPLDPLQVARKFRISVPKHASIEDLYLSLSPLARVPSNEMILVNVIGGKASNVYTVSNDSLPGTYKPFSDEDLHAVYQVPAKYELVIVLYHRRSERELVGFPRLLTFSTATCAVAELYQAVNSLLKNYVLENDVNEGSSEVAMDTDTFPFTLAMTNAQGNTTIEELPADSTNLVKSRHLNNSVYVAVDWIPAVLDSCLLLEKTKQYEVDASCENSTSRYGVELSDCLQLFTSEEQLGKDDPWYCPRCKEHRQAFKKFDIYALPEYLIIHLKRFQYTRWHRDKLDAQVNCPRTLEMGRYCLSEKYKDRVYDLIAVDNHYGGLGGGHYTAYAYNHLAKSWFYFDDSSVSPAQGDNVVTKAAYILVYKLQQSSAPASDTTVS